MEIDAIVEFRDHVYEKPFAPYYDEYRNHRFKVKALFYRNTHAELICITDPNLRIRELVHPNDLREIK